MNYQTKKDAQIKIEEMGMTEAYSPVFISAHYAKNHGVKREGWYIFNNTSKKIV